MKDKLLQIINHYGVVPQLKHFQSEVFELNEAIIEYKYPVSMPIPEGYFNHKEHITEEIADCLVMLRQFQEYYGISEVEICEICEQKVDRQLERIAKEG